MYMDVHCIEGLLVVFLTMGEVARIPICMKDFVSYKTGQWKCLEWFLFFIIMCKLTIVVKKWIPQYKAAAVNLQGGNMSFHPSLFTEKALLTSECNSLVLFLE